MYRVEFRGNGQGVWATGLPATLQAAQTLARAVQTLRDPAQVRVVATQPAVRPLDLKV
jgi:hypothetical protein